MTYLDNVVGKLQITYEDTTNDKFTETPFYICGNPFVNQAVAKSMNDRIQYAMAQMDELANNSNISSKVIYELDLVIPE